MPAMKSLYLDFSNTREASSGDQLDASLVFEKSKYKGFMAGIGQDIDWSGRSLDRTPKAAATLGYSHEWLLPQASLTARVASKYSSSYVVSDFVDAVHITQKSFTRTDLTLTYKTENEKYYVQGFIRNIEDKIQMTGGLGNFIPGLPNAPSVAVSEPRMFGVRVGTRF